MNRYKKKIIKKDEIIKQHEAKIKLLEQEIKQLEEEKEYYRNLALVDNLTNLYNRRAVDELSGYDSIIFADVDHFKDINDEYGHKAGDKVLKAIGQFLKDNIRETDLAVRWGGDEFLILLKNCSIDDAVEKAVQLKNKLKEFNEDFNFNITMSFGVSNLGDKSFAESISQADQAMYESKEAGRDRVTLYELK